MLGDELKKIENPYFRPIKEDFYQFKNEESNDDLVIKEI